MSADRETRNRKAFALFPLRRTLVPRHVRFDQKALRSLLRLGGSENQKQTDRTKRRKTGKGYVDDAAVVLKTRAAKRWRVLTVVAAATPTKSKIKMFIVRKQHMPPPPYYWPGGEPWDKAHDRVVAEEETLPPTYLVYNHLTRVSRRVRGVLNPARKLGPVTSPRVMCRALTTRKRPCLNSAKYGRFCGVHVCRHGNRKERNLKPCDEGTQHEARVI